MRVNLGKIPKWGDIVYRKRFCYLPYFIEEKSGLCKLVFWEYIYLVFELRGHWDGTYWVKTVISEEEYNKCMKLPS